MESVFSVTDWLIELMPWTTPFVFLSMIDACSDLIFDL
jgi:hypothetical protein